MLNMTIGLNRVADSVLEQMRLSPPSIIDGEFLRLFAKCLVDIKIILGAHDGHSFIIPGTGTMGMEMCVSNFVSPGSSAAIISTGFWGERWAAICRRLGINVHQLTCPGGNAPDMVQVKSLLSGSSCRAVLSTHVDSSSGVLTDLQSLGAVARESGAITIVDGICAAGIETIEQSLWNIDVYLTSSHKGLGVPAGLNLISVSNNAMSSLTNRSWECPSFSLDLTSWIPVMRAAEEGTLDYFQSPAATLILGLCEGLRLVRTEGVEMRADRHHSLRQMLHAGLLTSGIKLLITDTTAFANGVTVCLYPDSRGPDFLEDVKKCGVLLAAGMPGGVTSNTFRIGHMGNVTPADIKMTLRAIQQAM